MLYAHIHKTERKKLDPKSRKSILLGYGENIKGYRLYDLKEKKVFYWRDVMFQEMTFKNNKKTALEKIEESDEEIEETATEKVIIPEMTYTDNEIEDLNNQNENNQDVREPERRSTRTRKSPEYYGEWVNIASVTEEPKTVNEALSGINSQKWTEAVRKAK